MRRRSLQTVALLAGSLCLSVSCSGNFDTSRKKTEPVGTLGEDMYSALCDRVGASALAEDLTGISYHSVCHRNAAGQFGDTVDEGKLPPVAGGAAVARQLGVAKLNAMVRRRDDLIAAFNATFSDDPVDDPFHPGQTVRGHVALKRWLQRVVPLYDSNPINPALHEPLMPSVTRSVGRLFASLAGPGKDSYSKFGDPAKAQAAQQALSALSGRLGYRPLRVALGAIRPALAYPKLREMAQVFTPRMIQGGAMHDAFQNMLGNTQNELGTSVPAAIPAPYQADPLTLQPNRPRSNMEIARAIMLSTDPTFATGAPKYLVTRDARGYAVPAGNEPGQPGTVFAPFKDDDGDGLADVDEQGRFIGLAPADTPFPIPIAGIDNSNRDTDGRLPIFSYIDTSQTFVASTTKDLDVLLNPDPAAQSEALADLLSGAYALYGDPIQNTADWAVGGVYPTFDTQTSPILDLLYATGWMFAHKDSDLHLKFVKQLFMDPAQGGHRDLMARLIGAALKIREISNQHPEAALDPSVTIWDELGEIIVKTGKDPALFKDVLRSLTHPDSRAYFANAYANYMSYKDDLYYDTNNLNADPVNITDSSNPDPHVAVDHSQPDEGDNRSDFSKILQAIHDVDGAATCNKADAHVKMNVLGLNLSWPLGAGYPECGLFYFKDLGLFYLDSIIGDAKLTIQASDLQTLMNLAKIFADPNQLFEQSSGVTGMTLTPAPQGLNRLVFFGAESPKFDPLFGGKMPDRDLNWNGTNKLTNDFIAASIDAVSSVACPERLVTVPTPQPGDPGSLWLSDCALAGGDPNNLMRLRNKGIIFLWEKYDFYKAMAPLLKAFKAHSQGKLFLDSIEVLYRHWQTAEHGPECNNQGTFGDRPWQKFASDVDAAQHNVNPSYNPIYCNGSGLSRYEPILVEAFHSDLLPALADLVDALDKETFTNDRAGGASMGGLDVLYEMTMALFDPDYAASIGLHDRQGNVVGHWANNEISKPQITMFDLFADAMRKIDERLPEGDPRRDRWHNARSKLVDQLLSVDDTGQFRNPAFIASIPILIDVLREQINANCPTRETDPTSCVWATQELAQKAEDTIGGPTFGTVMSLLDLINEDVETRHALEEHLRYLVEGQSQNDAQVSMLASSADMMQVLGDDQNMPAIYNAIATAAAPDSDTANGKPAPGIGDRLIELMNALKGEPGGNPNPYDPYKIQDRMLVNLVTPLDPTNPVSPTPLEIFLDTFAEVNRWDADQPQEEPLSPEDLQAVFASMRDFMASKTRGMEQFYEIMRHRNGD
jgi:hypothetical protein